MRRGRTLLVFALIVSLLISVGLQKLATLERNKLLRTASGTTSNASLANMDSYALALLLGGMRGPLVMFLWMHSEAQKQAKDLEGVETQIEWIRLLQPEFDTVHLFQIWNKAFNISVQMASLANKYSVILDAIEYARSIDRQRPDNINMLMSLANILNDKISNSAEKAYYRNRVREDTQYRPAQNEPRVAGARPVRYQSLLDKNGNILPELLKSRITLPGTVAPGDQRYNGSELQYLEKYQPFPYGVPAFGLAYNYFARSRELQSETNQRHLQISPMVIDSRPALALRAWTEEEWELGSKAEDRLLGVAVPADRFDALRATASLNPENLTPEQRSARSADMAKAMYHYGLAITLAEDSLAAFQAHLANPDYRIHVEMYRSHLEHLAGLREILTADRAVLLAAGAQGTQREGFNDAAVQGYRKAMRMFQIIRLRYFSPEDYYSTLFPKGMDRWGLEKATDAQVAAFNAEVDRRNKERGFDVMEEDSREYKAYIDRCAARIRLLSK